MILKCHFVVPWFLSHTVHFLLKQTFFSGSEHFSETLPSHRWFYCVSGTEETRRPITRDSTSYTVSIRKVPRRSQILLPTFGPYLWPKLGSNFRNITLLSAFKAGIGIDLVEMKSACQFLYKTAPYGVPNTLLADYFITISTFIIYYYDVLYKTIKIKNIYLLKH